MEYKPQTQVQQLASHIKKNLEKGYTSDALRFSLMNQGYSRISVDKAIELANKQLAAKVPLIKEKPEIIYKIIRDDEEGSKEEIINILPKKNSFWKRLFKRS